MHFEPLKREAQYPVSENQNTHNIFVKECLG